MLQFIDIRAMPNMLPRFGNLLMTWRMMKWPCILVQCLRMICL